MRTFFERQHERVAVRMFALPGRIKPLQVIAAASEPFDSRRGRLSPVGIWVLTFAFALVCAGSGWAQESLTSEQQQAQTKLAAMKAQIAVLAAQQREAGTQRSALQASMVKQADVLAAAAKAVRVSETALAETRARLDDLRAQEHAAAAGLDAQRDALAELLRAAYTLGRGSDLRLLLGHVASCAATDNARPSAQAKAANDISCRNGERALERISRALAYSRYFQRDRVKRIESLLHELAQLDDIRKSIETQRNAEQAILDERTAQAEALEVARAHQAVLLAQVEAKLKTQAERLQRLQHDQQALAKLVASLRDVFADIPRGLDAAKPFASLRGKLPWPIQGKFSRQEQGIEIQADNGSTVRAVAHGRVAYSDWLRGYGMLLILDHGDGWMSLYGGNESLLHSVGEWVSAGDAIATSGHSEGRKPGLYFGLRHDGESINPQSWLRKR